VSVNPELGSWSSLLSTSLLLCICILQAKRENESSEHLSLAILLVVVDSAKKLPVS